MNSCKRGQPNIVKFDTLEKNIQEILRVAVDVRKYSYCRYSKFRVGAGLLCDDGEIVSGCNVENVSFTTGMCAERVAYCTAISVGKIKFSAVGVVGDFKYTTPCGACRQFISEFGPVDIYISTPDLDTVLITNLDELLPHAFQASDNPLP